MNSEEEDVLRTGQSSYTCRTMRARDNVRADDIKIRDKKAPPNKDIRSGRTATPRFYQTLTYFSRNRRAWFLIFFLVINVRYSSTKQYDYSDNNSEPNQCSSCVAQMRDYSRESTIYEIKMKIAEKLFGVKDYTNFEPPKKPTNSFYYEEFPGLTERQKHSTSSEEFSSPHKVRHAIKKISNLPGNPTAGPVEIVEYDETRVYALARPCSSNCERRGCGSKSVNFSVTAEEQPKESRLVSVQLWLRQQKHHFGCTEKAIIVVSICDSNNINEKTSLSEERTFTESSEWFKINLSNIVGNRFKNNRSSSILLSIQCTFVNSSLKGRPPIIVDLYSEPNSAQFHPMLELQYEPDKRKRSRRSADDMDCMEDQPRTTCCRYPLKISFDEFKWDFVIAPREYDAFYCSGDCPRSHKQFTPHTYIAQYATNKSRCCVPSKMAAMNLLYFGKNGNIHFSQIEDMVVEKCNCV